MSLSRKHCQIRSFVTTSRIMLQSVPMAALAISILVLQARLERLPKKISHVFIWLSSFAVLLKASQHC